MGGKSSEREVSLASGRNVAEALASLVSEEDLAAGTIIPLAFDKRVGPTVAAAVAEAARKSGVARI